MTRLSVISNYNLTRNFPHHILMIAVNVVPKLNLPVASTGHDVL